MCCFWQSSKSSSSHHTTTNTVNIVELVLIGLFITWRCPQLERHPGPTHTGRAGPAPRAASCLGRARSASPSPPPASCQTARAWQWPACCGRSPPGWACGGPGGGERSGKMMWPAWPVGGVTVPVAAAETAATSTWLVPVFASMAATGSECPWLSAVADDSQRSHNLKWVTEPK